MNLARVRSLAGLGALVVAVLAACEGKTTKPTPEQPAIAVAVGSSSVSVTAGTNGTVGVTLTRSGGFTGAVSVSAAGAPSGVTINPITLATGETSGSLTIATTAAAPVGTSTITLSASGTGVATKTATFTLNVTAPPGFTLTLPAPTLALQAGTNGTATINLARSGGFTGPIALTVTGAPAGLTATLDSASVGGTSTTLRLAANAALAAGTYTLTITGTGTGVPNQTATLTVNVTAAPPAGGFTLTLAPATVSVQAGASVADTVKIARTGTFSGAVGLSVTGAPTGMTVTLDSTSVAGGRTILRIATTAAVPAANYTLTIAGTAAGVTNQSAQLTVTVTAAPAGSFSLALAPTTLSFQAGANAVDTVKITRTGSFTGAVGLAVTGAPAGITVTLDSASVGGGRTILRIASTAAVVPGNYTLTITGTGTGVSNQTATLQLTVTAPSTGGNVSYTFCGDVPIWVAAQDGTGAWTRITSTNNTYSFNVTTRGGLAYVTGDAANGFQLYVFYGTAQEFQSQGGAGTQCTTSAGGKTVNGSVLGLGLTDAAMVSLGSSSQFVIGATGSTFTLTDVPGGTLDLAASRLSLSGSAFTLNKLYLQRGLNPADGSTLDPIDFSSAAYAFDPVTKTVTIANLGADTGAVASFLHTANGSTVLFGTGGEVTSTTASFPSIPTSKLISGDVQAVIVSATAGVNSRAAGAFFSDPADQTITLGAPIAGATASVIATTPYVRMRISYTPQADYGTAWEAMFSQGSAATLREATIAMSAGYRTSTGALALEIPDLSGVAGWNNDWGLKTGVSTTWTLSAFGWSGTGAITLPFVVGTTFREATTQGTVTP